MSDDSPSENGRLPRGTLKVYLGAAPGVGKTYAMLEEAHALVESGEKVIAAVIETHGRKDTARLTQGLTFAKPKDVDYRGQVFQEIDVEGIIAEEPDVVLVDELAHSVVTSAGPVRKRWEDVVELQNAGIDVISTVNIQHLESLSDVVEEITGIRQQETIPDRVLRRADEIELVDLSPAALRIRLNRGQIYRPDTVDTALAKYFRLGNLTALRELALLWMADQVDAGLEAYRQQENITETWPARERIMVAVTGGEESAALIRRGTRIVGRAAGRELVVVHVISHDGTGADSADAGSLADLKALTESFGGSWHVLTGDSPADTLLDFARTHNAAQLVVGASRSPWYLRVLGPGVASRLIAEAGDIDVHIVGHDRPGRTVFQRGTRSALARSRRIVGWILAVVLPLALTAVFLMVGHSEEMLIVNILSYMAAEVAVALIGGWWPALFTALAGSLVLNWFFIHPVGGLTISAPQNIIALIIFVLVAASVARVVDVAARRTNEARSARAHAMLMSELAGSVVREGSNIPALLSTIRETYGLDFALLQERTDPESTWETLYSVGEVPEAEQAAAPQGASSGGSDDDQTEEFTLDEDSRLVISAHPLSADEHQTMAAYAGRILMLTRQRQLRTTRLEAQRLQAANAVRTTLLTAVSHDLRTPLASIKTAVSSLRMTDVELPADLQQELLGTIEDSADRLDRIVSDLLHMSRVQTGTLEVHLRDVEVHQLVESALESLDPTAMPADLSLDIPDRLPQVTTDPGLVERIIANLVHNAHKHSVGPVTVQAEWMPADDAVEVRVVDHGKGLTDAEKQKLFTPFSHMADSGPGGVGLGGAVAKGLADAIDAQLVPEDTPGGGLTMVLGLPAADSAVIGEAADNAAIDVRDADRHNEVKPPEEG